MQLLDGKHLAQTIQDELRASVQAATASGTRAPHLAAVLVGNNPASAAYVRNKMKACEYVGFRSSLVEFADDVSEQTLLDTIRGLNEDADLDGFIVQLPLPKHIDEEKVTFAIAPAKDVDGFHPLNLGLMLLGSPTFIPATPFGILEILRRYQIPTKGKHCVVVGRSNIVGTPMSVLMSRNSDVGNCTVTLTHSHTQNLTAETLKADILIAAIGKPLFIKGEMVKEGAVVIDVGINSIDDATSKKGYKLVGDVDFDAVAPKCSYITPVPGGVGAMTVTALLMNTWTAYKKTFGI